MVDVLKRQQLIVVVVDKHHEIQRCVPARREANALSHRATGSTLASVHGRVQCTRVRVGVRVRVRENSGAPLVDDLSVVPLDEVAQLLGPRQDQVGALADELGLRLLRVRRVPLGQPHFGLSADQQEEVQLRGGGQSQSVCRGARRGRCTALPAVIVHRMRARPTRRTCPDPAPSRSPKRLAGGACTRARRAALEHTIASARLSSPHASPCPRSSEPTTRVSHPYVYRERRPVSSE